MAQAKATQSKTAKTQASVSRGAMPRGLGKGLDSLIPTGVAAKKEPQEVKEEAKETAEATSMVRISMVEPNKDQPRQFFDEEALEELSQSIAQYGVLTPILVQDRGNHYEIIAGERRWRAALKAGLKEIPVVIRKYTEQEILEISIIENLQREDINDIEEALAYKRLMDEFHLTQEDVAKKVSKSRTAITNKIRLLKLTEEVQEYIKNGKLSEGHARALIGVANPEQQLRLANKIVEEELNVREVEKLIRDLNKPQKANTKDKKSEQLDAVYASIEENLKQKLGTKVNVVNKGNGAGKIEIEFYNNDELERILEAIR